MFTVEYRTLDGKNKKVKGQLAPPDQLAREKKQEGVSGKVVCYDYAKKVQEVYQTALPATAAAALTEWKI